MNLQHRDFATPQRSFPKSDVLTATVAVTPDLYIGAVAFGTFEARVTIYRDDMGEILIDGVEVEGWLGRQTTWVHVEEAANGFSVDQSHHAFDAVVNECKRPSIIAKMEEALSSAEREWRA